MSNKKQTSLEWLYKQVWITPISKLTEVLEQAKELHRQEIMDAYWEGSSNWDNDKDAE